jgi:transposase
MHWLHVLDTDTLTWRGCHPKRGSEAFDALALLGQFKGVLVHDGWLNTVLAALVTRTFTSDQWIS